MRNITVSCISTHQTLALKYLRTLQKKTIEKVFFVCDDFNIGLLNLNKQKMSSVFLNSLWVYILKLQGRAELHLTVPP